MNKRANIPKVSWNNSLTFMLIFWFLSFSLVPLSIMTYLSYVDSTSKMEELISVELKSSAQEEAGFLENWFDNRRRDLLSWSQTEAKLNFLKSLSQEFMKSSQNAQEFITSDVYAKIVSKSQTDFITLSKQYSYIYDLFLIDNSGNILYTIAKESDLGTNLLTGAYSQTKFAQTFRRTIEDGEIYFSDLEFYEPSNGDIASFITTPLIDKSGVRVGVIAVQLKTDELFALLKNNSRSIKDDQHYLTDSQGYLRHDILNKGKALVDRIDGEQFELFKHEHVDALSDADHDEKISYRYLGLFGEPVLGLHHPVQLMGVQWVLFVEKSLRSIHESAFQMALKAFTIFFIIMLFLIVATVVLARKITKPILALSEASSRFADGDRNVSIEINTKNEIGLLANAFNKMVDSLQQNELKLQEQTHEAQEALRNLDEQKLALNTHSIVAITDIKGNITFANKKFEEVSGYSLDELMGKNHRLVNSGFHPKEFWTNMYKTVTSGEIWHAEVCNLSKEKKIYWVDTTIVPFFNENNKLESYVAIRTDITESKELEFKLLEAKQIAEDTLKVKSEFLASMSHEIRTPMNGVLGMLSLLSSSELTSNQAHHVHLAQSSATSLLTLINDILDFSKIEAGKLELENIDFNIRNELGDFAEAIAFKAQEKHVELILDTTKIHQTVIKSDPGRIRQIMSNIVGNSVKFTSEGHILIKASLDESNKENVRLIVKIEDTGIGIPANKIDTLFDSFTQVDASTTRKYGGTGLGLAIVKKLVEIMDGSVSVESVLGQGTAFTVDIKVELGENSSLVMPSVSIEGKRILIVDDNEVNQEVLHSQLELWGMKVYNALDAKSAIKMCQEEVQNGNVPPYDIAFLDMQMPEMDGSELGKILRADVNCDSMKLVMMTSLGFRTDVKHFADIGFDAFFPKPATTNDIFHALNVLVEDGEAFKSAQPLLTRDYLGTLNETEEPMLNPDVKILLVDDNLTNQLVAEGILENIGLACDIASNGAEALDMIRSASEPYHIVLMDCQMPVMDGYTASTAIREGKAGDENKNVAIIAMTANAMQGDREKCISSGMDDYISKPINPIILKATLQKWIEQGNGALNGK